MALSAFDEFLYIKLQLNQFSGLADRGCGKKNLFCVFFFFLTGLMPWCFEVKIEGLASKSCEFAFCCPVKIHLDLAKIHMGFRERKCSF